MRFVSAARLVLVMATACAAPMAQGAAAPTDANYPTKPIRMIVPFSPGGTNDILARMIGTHLTEVMGKTVIVDNRAGAEGIIGTELAVRAAPDGYTLIVLSAAYVMNPAVRKLPYDPITALEFIARVGTSATLLCVGPSLPVSSVKEMLAVAKSKPGQITLGSSGGFQHFATALFRSLSGQDFNIVLYKGAFPAMMDVIGGQLHATIVPIVPSLPHLRSGRLKALATGALKRSALLPELPTLDELGISGYDASNTYTFATTAGTPPAIVKRLHTVIVSYIRAPETEKRLTAMGAEIDIKTPDEMRKIIPVEIAKWTKVARAAGMAME
jgi:tripartite-type tricarboxylate transporter receptor subunit TctC